MWQKNWAYKLFTPLLLSLCSWGFTAHRDIHSAAITGLPNEVWAFFKKNEKRIIELSVAADRRKHTDSNEAIKHYLDVDLIKDSLENHGELHNAICDKYNHLSYLFYNIDSVDHDYIFRVASDLGHYISDAHVPLQTTSNYNGQKTGQIGIHALWETHVYELTKGSRVHREVKARYIGDIDEYAKQIINQSHELVPIVLEKEKEVRFREGAPHKWGYRTRGRTMDLYPTPSFCKEYSDSLYGMVQKRYFESAEALASVWYSAWVDGGSPNLDRVIRESTSETPSFGLKLQELLSSLRMKRRQKQDKLEQ